MVKEEHIIKIINNEFDILLKHINSISQIDNNNELSQQKIFIKKLYKNIELTKASILLNIKNYFSNFNLTNLKTNQINQLTKFLHSKKRNKSQNILKFKTKININKNNRNLFYSVINGSSTDLNNNNSYFSPSSNKKKIQMKPLVIDMKNLRTYKGKNTTNNTNTYAISYLNNNFNTNNSNIIHNPYNINNIISSEEGDQDIKAIMKRNSFIKKNINCIMNKSHSELKLRLKDKNNFSSNKVCHQKKKISLVDDIINNITLFNKDNKNKNKKNLKIITNTVNADGKNEKNISFINKTKNCTQSFWKNNKKKIIINKINLQKLNLNTKTKTEIINKKKKMLNFSSNNFIKKNNNNIKVTNNNSFKRNSKILNKNISHSVNINNQNNNNNNSLSYNIIDNNDDSINNNSSILAKEIINFLDNLKNLQNSIIRKESDTKNMKINFEMQKISLYQKAKNILNNNNNNTKNINNNNFNDSKSNISNNSKGLNSTTVKSDSLSYIKNYFGNNIKNSFSGILNNNNNNDSIIKELNISNLKKTIEDIKINDENINEHLKNEINILNNKLNEKVNKEKKYEKIISDNLNQVINVHKNLLNYSSNNNNVYCNVPSDKKFDWYIHEINEIIEKFGNEWKNINFEKNKINDFNENNIKKQLYKATLDIINWIGPYMELNNDDIKKYISKLEEEFNNYGIKQALNSLKSKIKELVYFLEINNIKKNENEINNIINFKNIINKEDFIKLNSVILDIQNNLLIKIEKKNDEISSINNDLQKSLKLNNKIINILSTYFPQETRIFQEKYNYILSLYNAEQDKVNLLQNEYINIIEGLINYIDKGNKIYIELGKMWNIKPKKETSFELIEPDSSDMGHLSESDLLSSESEKRKETNNDIERYKEEIEQYKKTFKYLENKISKYDILLNNIVNILIKIIKNIKLDQKQKELFFTLFRMLNIKDENIINLIKNENKK